DKPAQKLFAGASWHPFLPTFCFSWSCNCILTAGHTRVLYSTKLRRKGSCNAGSVVIAWIRLRSRVDGALQDFLTFCSIGRVRSRVRPVDTADVAPGPNALRGTGPDRKPALESARTQAGLPIRGRSRAGGGVVLCINGGRQQRRAPVTVVICRVPPLC